MRTHPKKKSGRYTPTLKILVLFTDRMVTNCPITLSESLMSATAIDHGSFDPTMQFGKLEIHKVCLRFPNFYLCQNLSLSILVGCIIASSFLIINYCFFSVKRAKAARMAAGASAGSVTSRVAVSMGQRPSPVRFWMASTSCPQVTGML